MTTTTESEKITVLAEWVGCEFDKSWNPFIHGDHWDILANQLRIRGKEWKLWWSDQIEYLIGQKYCWAGPQTMLLYHVATASPAEKSDALYWAIVARKESG